MLMSPSDFDIELEELHNQSVGRLLMSDNFDASAYSRLYDYLCQKAEVIKAEHIISKQIVAVLFSAQRSIENSAPYNLQAKENLAFSAKFLTLLELISIGESPRDRQPGIPRVV